MRKYLPPTMLNLLASMLRLQNLAKCLETLSVTDQLRGRPSRDARRAPGASNNLEKRCGGTHEA